MSDYIEGNKGATQVDWTALKSAYNCSGEPGESKPTCPYPETDGEIFTGIFSYLNDWDKWTDEERMKIFSPYIFFVTNSNVAKQDTGEMVMEAVAKKRLETGRLFKSVGFDLTTNSAIVCMIELCEVKLYQLPDCILKEKISRWVDLHSISD